MVNAKRWPTPNQYAVAIQKPAAAFRDPRLRGARFKPVRPGLYGIEGQRAVVFLADAKPRPVAVRCLKEPMPDGAQRYAAIRAHLAAHPVTAIPSAEWIESGIRVDDKQYPIIVMDQVEGSSLLVFVEKHLRDSPRLVQLAADWRTLMRDLAQADVAHGDLQQSNVRVTNSQCFRLVDLDGMWVPSLAGIPAPAERGHKNYQHPGRIAHGHWGRHMDTFSALVIYISLLALAADPDLLEEFSGDQNLIFRQRDFAEPGRTPVWARVSASPNLRVRSLATLLARSCRSADQVSVDLEALLDGNGQPSRQPAVPAWLAGKPGRRPGPAIGLARAEATDTGPVATGAQRAGDGTGWWTQDSKTVPDKVPVGQATEQALARWVPTVPVSPTPAAAPPPAPEPASGRPYLPAPRSSWPRRHPVLTAAAWSIVVLLIVLIVVAG